MKADQLCASNLMLRETQENNMFTPMPDDIFICCKAGFLNFEGNVESFLPPTIWRAWIDLRSALSASYRQRIRATLIYVRDSKGPLFIGGA